MVEMLFSCATLMSVGLMSKNEYNDLLDELFLETPDSDLLIELEFVSSDMDKTISIIKSSSDIQNMDYTIFGELLMEGLKKMYSKLSLEDFSSKAYMLWKLLPEPCRSDEPFFALSYADDPLSWGDKEQTRTLYEKMFKFYSNK